MKTLTIILTLIISNSVFANGSCLFNDPFISELIAVSEELDICFSSDTDPCKIKLKSPGVQANLNKSRIIPMDRKTGNGFMDHATGIVSVKFGKYGGEYDGAEFVASAQKISRCHIITSAHLIYANPKLSIESTDFSLKFKSGQSCNLNKPFENEVSVSLFFKMTDGKKADFQCKSIGPDCGRRLFKGKNDLVILKLKDFEKEDGRFFKLNTEAPKNSSGGQKINCWGYTSQIGIENLTSDQSEMYLWTQKDARMFGDNNGRSVKGVLTNAISRKGMSGSGCTVANKPNELVGVFSKDNKGGGNAAVDINLNNVITHAPNYLSAFNELSERYSSENGGKKLDDLDKECDN